MSIKEILLVLIGAAITSWLVNMAVNEIHYRLWKRKFIKENGKDWYKKFDQFK